jgi:HlyD family secretion protein
MSKGPLLLAILIGTAVAVGTRSYWREPLAPYLASLERTFGLAHREDLLGYMEADTTLVAAPAPGRLLLRSVRRGDHVEPGTPLFSLDLTEIDATIARLTAQISAAEARLANARTGKRPQEQDVVRAQQDEARATLELAEKELVRQRELQRSNASARNLFDQATAQVAQQKARLSALEAQEKAGDLPARPGELDALEADLAAARAARAETVARRAQMMPASPVSGQIEDTFYDAGEWVPAGSPVLSIVPDDALKLRFFLPEAKLADVTVGARLTFSCDGCRTDLTARIERIASKAEYTPPVIYSTGARAKLVFLVEAVPLEKTGLKPGLPVEVRLAGARP